MNKLRNNSIGRYVGSIGYSVDYGGVGYWANHNRRRHIAVAVAACPHGSLVCYVGVANCSHKDQYRKRLGHDIATGRALHAMHINHDEWKIAVFQKSVTAEDVSVYSKLVPMELPDWVSVDSDGPGMRIYLHGEPEAADRLDGPWPWLRRRVYEVLRSNGYLMPAPGGDPYAQWQATLRRGGAA